MSLSGLLSLSDLCCRVNGRLIIFYISAYLIVDEDIKMRRKYTFTPIPSNHLIMESLTSSQEMHFSPREMYYSRDDSKLDLMFTNTELGDRVYADFSSEILDTPPELLYLCAIVQAMIVVPRMSYWYMLEHAILSPRGELFLQYAVHNSLSNPYHSLPVYADSVSPALACRRFTFPIDIENVDSLKHCANALRNMIANGSLTQLKRYLEPVSQEMMIAVHATGQDNFEDLPPACTTDLAVECVERGMWSLVEILSNGVDVGGNLHYEVAGTIGYCCPGYGLVSNVEKDQDTKTTFYREIIRLVDRPTKEEQDGEDSED
ncbi:uncharacterized protein BT62DRAFT_992504 [Guyanagaster necrorhizus]|uniref:Uncharacterized protein n=1 Tax=Guyanagaster necrorhizus TaxID=856835 RepID=A0A9P7VWU4_9AGAR|nr:uncharacterized protein BT62DRAFT_992504 [Guyanagaster necrorhizus MCA 3950]KAG7448419.1 hypothetical protein BT62DRAFT_992504 [Guyanagaster necrorhizus MCA 3950]